MEWHDVAVLLGVFDTWCSQSEWRTFKHQHDSSGPCRRIKSRWNDFRRKRMIQETSQLGTVKANVNEDVIDALTDTTKALNWSRRDELNMEHSHPNPVFLQVDLDIMPQKTLVLKPWETLSCLKCENAQWAFHITDVGTALWTDEVAAIWSSVMLDIKSRCAAAAEGAVIRCQ